MLSSTTLLAAVPVPDCAAATDADCVSVGDWQFGVALGYGLARNPVREQDDIELSWLPRLSYYGERFFLETRTLGFTLAETDADAADRYGRLNLLAWPNADYGWFRDGDVASNGLFPSLTLPVPTGYIDPRGLVPPPQIRRLENRRLTYLLGIDASWQQDELQLRARLGADLSAGHDGWQAEFQVARQWQWGATRLQAEAGLLYRDDKLSDYYYGVDAGEMDYPLYSYQATASFSSQLGLCLHHAFSEQWGLLLSWSGQRFGRPIADSPIMAERNASLGFVGITYDF